MDGGFRPLRHPATPVDEIDLDGTRQERQRLHQELRRRQALLARLLADDKTKSPEADQLDDA
jgi:hypothetical protein